MPKPGSQPASNPVIRFVNAVLIFASHRLRNRSMSPPEAAIAIIMTAPALMGRRLLHAAATGGLLSRGNSPGLPLVLRFDASPARLRRQHVGQFVGFLKPVSNGRLDFIAVLDVNDVIHLGLRRPVASSHLWSFQFATEEHAEFEKVLLRANEEVAGVAREHDRLVRSVNPLFAKRNGCFPKPLPRIPQIVREVSRQSRFGGSPTVVLFAVLDPLLAVVAFPTGHVSNCTGDSRLTLNMGFDAHLARLKG